MLVLGIILHSRSVCRDIVVPCFGNDVRQQFVPAETEISKGIIILSVLFFGQMLYEKGISFILFHKVPILVYYRKIYLINSFSGRLMNTASHFLNSIQKLPSQGAQLRVFCSTNWNLLIYVHSDVINIGEASLLFSKPHAS